MNALAKIDIYDAVGTESKDSRLLFSLTLNTESITVLELIHARVEMEMDRIATSGIKETSLFALTEKEVAVNGTRSKRWLESTDLEKCQQVAVAGFNANAYFVLANDRQLLTLDEVIPLDKCESVTFYRLMPLEGG